MAQRATDDGIAQLAEGLRGHMITPDDPDYDDARSVWNGMIDRRPALIVRCTGVADVMDALAFARERDLPVSVRGGGHNVAGSAVCDDGLVVDCSEMTAVSVDPDERVVRVEGGATWADVDRETQAFGLAAPGGVVSDTGVAGLTLGGGIGHLRRAHGLSCDNLRSVEVVTADGEFLTASAEENAELFWACRGGGGGGGVVTAFEFELHPVGPEVAFCLVFYAAEDLPEMLAGFREFSAEAPDEVSALTFSGELPEEALFDGEALHEDKIAVLGCYAGPPDAGERALAPLRELAQPMADESGTMPYVELQQLLDEDYPDGMRYYWKSLYLEDLSAAAIDRIAHWTDAAPSPLSTVDVWQLGGEIARADPDESAFPARDAPFLLGVEANWEDPVNDDANVRWVRECLADMRRFSDGSVYLNFPGFHEEGEETWRTTFGSAYERLEAVKAAYDPEGRFDQNRTVAPTGGAQADGGEDVDG